MVLRDDGRKETIADHIAVIGEIKNRINKIGAVSGLIMLSGAHMYGFESKNSDFDYRGFYIARTGRLLGFDQSPEHIDFTLGENKQYDVSVMELKKFMTLAMRMNCNILEHIFAKPLENTIEALDLKNIIQSALAKRGLYDSYKGMAIFNYKKFIYTGKKKTVKKYLYVFRALLAGIYALTHLEIKPNIIELNDKISNKLISELIEDKRNGLEDDIATKKYEGIDNEITKQLEVLDAAYNESRLPEAPDREEWEYANHWLKKIRQKYWDRIE